MKKIALLILILLVNFNGFCQENTDVPKGKITGDFTITFRDKNITLTPNKEFSLNNLNLIEYNRSPKQSHKRGRDNIKIGREHIFWPIFYASYFGIAGVAALPYSFPLFGFTPLYINSATIKATNMHMNKVSYSITLTKPDGRKYNGKIAFFKVHKKCSTLDVGSEYHISLSDERLDKLDKGIYTDIAEYEYCSKHNRVTWVMWDITKAN